MGNWSRVSGGLKSNFEKYIIPYETYLRQQRSLGYGTGNQQSSNKSIHRPLDMASTTTSSDAEHLDGKGPGKIANQNKAGDMIRKSKRSVNQSRNFGFSESMYSPIRPDHVTALLSQYAHQFSVQPR